MRKILKGVMFFAILAVLTLASACGHTHEYRSRIVSPTCEKSGYTTHTCECGEEYTDSHTNAIGHDFVNYTSNYDATCTKNGTKTAKCTRKGCSVKDTVEMLDTKMAHQWNDGVVTQAATCTLAGNREYSCKACSAKNNETIEVIEHDYKETIVNKATCDTQGTKKFTCQWCSDYRTVKFNLKAYTASEIHELSKNSVGEITTYNKNGSGIALGTCFVYSTDGKIITNYHVIEDAYSAKIALGDKTYTVKSILAYDKTIDLAVLKIDAIGLTALDICTENHPVGKSVFAFGSSKGLTATFSQGIITYADREEDGVRYVQHDAAISNGNSAGPLINEYNEVIGINTFTLRDSQNLNFAISVTELSNLTYGTPITIAQFYEKECDVFTKLKNYVIQEGTYDAEDNEYMLTLGHFYSSDYSVKYTRDIYYEISNDMVSISLLDDSGFFTVIYIDEIDGIYEWGYIDKYDYYMSGTLYASTLSSNTMLGYSYTTTPASLISSVRKLASAMVRLSVLYINEDFASIGVTASDIGFKNY